jgi:cytochrome b561
VPYRYPATARWLHWITAALVIVLGVLGVWMTNFEPKDEAFKDLLYDIHESTGVALFVVVALRLLRRLGNPPGRCRRGCRARSASWRAATMR